jgi:hypothetical protein
MRSKSDANHSNIESRGVTRTVAGHDPLKGIIADPRRL